MIADEIAKSLKPKGDKIKKKMKKGLPKIWKGRRCLIQNKPLDSRELVTRTPKGRRNQWRKRIPQHWSGLVVGKLMTLQIIYD